MKLETTSTTGIKEKSWSKLIAGVKKDSSLQQNKK
jgi:hypothetical protein